MKKIYLFVLTILLTGCSSTYNITVDENKIDEHLKISIPTNLVNENTLQEQLEAQLGNYNIDYTNDSNNYYVDYTNNYDIGNYFDSKLINLCYDTSSNKITDQQIKITTSSQFRCIYMDDGVQMDSVDINITTQLKVIENNADEVNKNTYTWHINKNNYQNKPINITIQKNKTTTQTVKSVVSKIPNKEIIILSLGLIIVSIILYRIIKRKQKNINEL